MTNRIWYRLRFHLGDEPATIEPRAKYAVLVVRKGVPTDNPAVEILKGQIQGGHAQAPQVYAHAAEVIAWAQFRHGKQHAA